jgi:hypothetical protein
MEAVIPLPRTVAEAEWDIPVRDVVDAVELDGKPAAMLLHDYAG